MVVCACPHLAAPHLSYICTFSQLKNTWNNNLGRPYSLNLVLLLSTFLFSPTTIHFLPFISQPFFFLLLPSSSSLPPPPFLLLPSTFPSLSHNPSPFLFPPSHYPLPFILCPLLNPFPSPFLLPFPSSFPSSSFPSFSPPPSSSLLLPP